MHDKHISQHGIRIHVVIARETEYNTPYTIWGISK